MTKFKAQNKSKIQMTNIKTEVLSFACLSADRNFVLWDLTLISHYKFDIRPKVCLLN